LENTELAANFVFSMAMMK